MSRHARLEQNKLLLIPRASILSQFPSAVWWFAWPTVAGLVWLLLAFFLIIPPNLRSIPLVTLVASFMLSLWVLNLLYAHLRSMLVLECLLVALAVLSAPLAISLANWPFVAVMAPLAIAGALVWGHRRANIRRLRARRHVEQMPVAGDPFIVELQLHNPTVAIQRGLRGVDHGKFHYHRWSIPVLAAGQTVSTKYEVVLPHRGRYPWSALELSSAYPFGLFRKRFFLETTDSTIVLPRLGQLHQGKLRRLLLGPTRSVPPLRHRHARRTLVPADFCGVREFRSGDTPRFIHWRTTARAGKPMVREFEEPPLEHLIVVLDPWLPETVPQLLQKWRQLRQENKSIAHMVMTASVQGGTARRQVQLERLAAKEAPHRQPLDRLEEAVSLAATLCLHWGQQSGTKLYLAVADGPLEVLERKEPSARGARPLLERLAIVQGGPHPDVNGMGQALELATLPLCPVVVITTRPESPLPALLGRSMRRPVGILDVTQQLVHDLFTTDASAEALL